LGDGDGISGERGKWAQPDTFCTSHRSPDLSKQQLGQFYLMINSQWASGALTA